MNWKHLHLHPHRIEREDEDSFRVYVIDSCYVRHLEVDRATLKCTALRNLDFYADTTPEPIRTWSNAFFLTLRDHITAHLPSPYGTSTQWGSRYESTLDGRVYTWTEDRKEQSDYLDSVRLST